MNGYMTPTSAQKAVGATSTKVLDAVRVCSYRAFQNISDADIFLGFGAEAKANEGLMIAKAGGIYEMSREHGNLYLGEVNAIHAGTGDKNLLVIQGV